MNSRGRSRKEQHQVKNGEYGELAGKTPRELAQKEFNRKPYEIHDVPSYINRKYGNRGE